MNSVNHGGWRNWALGILALLLSISIGANIAFQDRGTIRLEGDFRGISSTVQSHSLEIAVLESDARQLERRVSILEKGLEEQRILLNEILREIKRR